MEGKRRCLADEVTLLCTKDVLTDVRNGGKRRKRETYPHTLLLRIRGIRFHGEKTGSEGFFIRNIFLLFWMEKLVSPRDGRLRKSNGIILIST